MSTSQQPGGNHPLPVETWLQMQLASVWDRWTMQTWGLTLRSVAPPWTTANLVPHRPPYTTVIYESMFDTLNNQHVYRYRVPVGDKESVVFDDVMAAVMACELGLGG